jgi:AcrR family transcriptional regulator
MTKPENERRREPREKSARDAILDGAEQLFAEHGYNGVTLRGITALAGTNLASVNYYFGSKERLFTEMINRRFGPIDAWRLQSLRAVLSEAGNGKPQLESILDAFARPFFECTADMKHDEKLQRVIARVLMETDSVAVRIFENELLPAGQLFVRAITQSRPDLSPWQVVFGLLFYSGALIHLLASLHRASSLVPDISVTPDNNPVLQTLVRCGVAAFDALSIPVGVAEDAENS